MKSVQRRRLNPLRRLRNRLSRIRHFRGHGIHSPYIYNIVREVFMRRTLLAATQELELYDKLQRVGEISRRYIVELQNVATHCGYRVFAVNSVELEGIDMVVVTSNHPTNLIEGVLREAISCGTTVAILHPNGRVEREDVCTRIVAEHKSTSIMRREYLLIFNNHLPKQHFEL